MLATLGSGEQEAAEAKTGLAGLLEQAKDITGDVESAVVGIVTMPLPALIDLAQVVLSHVQVSVDAAQNVIASVDAARC